MRWLYWKHFHSPGQAQGIYPSQGQAETPRDTHSQPPQVVEQAPTQPEPAVGVRGIGGEMQSFIDTLKGFAEVNKAL